VSTSYTEDRLIEQLAIQLMEHESVRSRFGIEKKNSAQASRLLDEALDASRIRLVNPDAANKLRRYVPYWA